MRLLMKIKGRFFKISFINVFLFNEYFLHLQLQEIHKHIYLNEIYSGLF